MFLKKALRALFLISTLVLLWNCSEIFNLQNSPSIKYGASDRILFIGNSITKSWPSEKFDWHFTRGMAASADSNDFVSCTIRNLKKRGYSYSAEYGSDYTENWDGKLYQTLEELKHINRTKNPLIVVQLGENMPLEDANNGIFEEKYLELLQTLASKENRKIYCVSIWGENNLAAPKNSAIRRAINQIPQARLIDISAVSADSSNYPSPGEFSDPAVMWHPGDRGMAEIGRLITEAIIEDFEAEN